MENATQENMDTSEENQDGTKGEQNNEVSWIDVLPEEAAKDPNITKYKTPEDFYKGFTNLTKMVGAKGVIIPKEDAPPEEYDKFYNAIGRPEKPDGYRFDEIKDLHKNVVWNKETDNGLANLFHQRGLSQKSANLLRNDFLGMINEISKKQEQKEAEAIKIAEVALRKEWGDKYETNRQNVAKLILKAGGEEAINAMGGENGLGNNPIILKTLAKIASLLSEDQINTIVDSSKSSTQGSETKEEAQKKINEILHADQKSHPYWNENDKKHDEAVAEMKRLYAIVHGGE